jgi:hypothetical protein
MWALKPPKCRAKNAPVAQLDRALDYESRGQEFESLRARQYINNLAAIDERRYRKRYREPPIAIVPLRTKRAANPAGHLSTTPQ